MSRPKNTKPKPSPEPWVPPPQPALTSANQDDVVLAGSLLQETYRKGISESILESVTKGNFLDTAVQAAGITTDAFYAALRIARQPVPPEGVSDMQWQFLRRFAVQLEQAEAKAETQLVASLLASGSASAVVQFLERRWPRKFAPPQMQQGTTKNTINQRLNINVSEMSSEQLVAMLEKFGLKPLAKE